MRQLVFLSLLLVLSLIVGCGGGTAGPLLISIAVSPMSATASAPNGTVRFTATGVFKGSPPSTTIFVVWSSSNTAIALVNTSGLARCVHSSGLVTITATAPNPPVSGTTVVSGAIPVSGTAQLTCI